MSSKTKPAPDPSAPRPQRKPASPDIQALAKIDRILSDLEPAVAARTITFLTAKFENPPIVEVTDRAPTA